MDRPNARAIALLMSLGLLASAATGCHHDDGAVLLVVVTAAGSPAGVVALNVTIMSPAAGSSSQRYASGNTPAISFPTTLTAELPARALGTLSVDVTAEDATGAAVASGHSGPLAVAAGSQPTVYVQLGCAAGPCTVDAGVGPPDAGTISNPRCGNGVVDPGETCDTAIAAGDPGACPPVDCDDGVACTTDKGKGADCTAVCTHQEITAPAPNDGCCPAGATSATDSDCSPTCGDGTVDPGEACDTGIAPGAPGACPSASDCTQDAPCAVAALISAGTCSAICMHYQIEAQIEAQVSGDGCCPPGGTNAVDIDCPVACGNGIRESGEACDIGLRPMSVGSCPIDCDDGDPCTVDFLTGAACQATCAHVAITAEISGDGCCPAMATHASDTDCPASCGDGVVEPGETCDKAARGLGACPTDCPRSPSPPCLQMLLVGGTADCSAHCVPSPLTACGQSDACCPAGCTAATDPDCSADCGDGIVETGEICDTAIGPGLPGACPASCGDGDPCTDDLLLSAGTCAATCVHLRVTELRAGDGCCPPGGDFTVDPDCAPICGNGVVERPVEACDYAAPDSCPTSCPDTGSCTIVALRGSPASCSASCVATAITGCVGGDGCCPSGCTTATDSDCPVVCGDGVVSGGEPCDRAITAGMPGACPRSCDDADACTVDLASGSVAGCTRTCQHDAITACRDDDGCCPAGCTAATDSDCSSDCGDRRIEAGETCDPPSTCPTSCPDDGDPCTNEQLIGDPVHCIAACRHVPITACSGSKADFCCPTGCSAATDSDC